MESDFCPWLGKFLFERFLENSCFQDLWFLRCIYNLWNQHLKYPLISIPRLGKFELLITVDREIISNWTFHHLFFLKRGNCGRQQFDWSRNNSWWRALTRKKKQYIWHILVSQHLDVNHIKPRSFCFQILKSELKNLVSIKSYSFVKNVIQILVLAQKMLTLNWELISIFFQKL